MKTPPAVVMLGAGALASAQRIQALYEGARLHGLQGRVEADVGYRELGAHLRDLYARGTPIVALCAAGIVIRCLAPLLANKGAEPPVLAVAEDGSAVVPLLGGLTGVNLMARDIAAAFAVAPAITTSGELRFGTCVLNPPDGYVLADIAQGKRFVSDLLAGESTRIEGAAPWLDDAPLPRADSARLAIHVTPRAWNGEPDRLVIHPRCVVAAVTTAVEPAATPAVTTAATTTTTTKTTTTATATPAADTASAGEQIAAQVRDALHRHGLAVHALAALVASAHRMTDPALADAAAALNVPLRFTHTAPSDGEPPRSLLQAALRVPYETLDAVDSADTADTADTAGTPREVRTTRVALALTPLAVDPDTVGHARGRVTVIGLGPGRADLMVPAARQALNDATDVLGYDTYVTMAGPFRADQRVHGTDNREELQRARHAFELASDGASVVVVSSGDPGVFAMAAAVLEALEGSQDARWASVELSIVPGVSAALATAAQAGAPLGHDFCMLSLSDNLKPWTVIENRLRHAAEADLVMAFYNPISRARPWQLDQALEIVRAYRTPATRVVLGRDIGRPGATLTTTTLGDLRAAQVDMRTMVIVGSSTTRGFARGTHEAGAPQQPEWVYTPRWYE